MAGDIPGFVTDAGAVVRGVAAVGGAGFVARVSSAFNRACASASSGLILRMARRSASAPLLSRAMVWATARRRYPSGSFGSIACALLSLAIASSDVFRFRYAYAMRSYVPAYLGTLII